MIKVLVADGQRLFTEALGLALQQYPDLWVVQHEASNGAGVVEAARQIEADVVLVDYWMLGMNGPEVTRALRTKPDGPTVILLSWIHGPEHVQEGLLAGAAGFLPKSLSVDQVVEAIRQARSGLPLVHASQLAGLVDDMTNRLDRSRALLDELIAFTPREIATLQLLAEGLTTAQIARDLHIAPGTLRNSIQQILAKMGAATRVQAVEMARAAGVVVTPRPTSSPPSH